MYPLVFRITYCKLKKKIVDIQMVLCDNDFIFCIKLPILNKSNEAVAYPEK